MYGLKLLNKEALSKIYDGFSDYHKLKIQNTISEYNIIKNKWRDNTISHKKWLAKVRGV